MWTIHFSNELGTSFMDDELLNQLGSDRITSRQVDELVGIARGVAADGQLNLAEVEFLQSWLAANLYACHQPLISTLYDRIKAYLSDGALDADEASELLETLRGFTGETIELGEMLKSTSLPLCHPAPKVVFSNARYCFTGTFKFGQRKDCERATLERGGIPGSLTSKTNFLVIGAYATESWKHSNFGTKIMKATDFRNNGHPIAIISEDYWTQHL